MAPSKGRKASKKVAAKATRKSPRSPAVKDEINEEDAMETEEGDTMEEDDARMPNENGISDYERARLENIRRNEMFLNELGVSGVRSSLTPAPKTKPARNSTPKQTFKVVQMPTRRSSRVTVEKLTSEVRQLREEGQEAEAAAKQVELDTMVAKQKEGAYEPELVAAASEEEYARLSTEPIAMTEIINEDEEAVKELLSSALKNTLLEARSALFATMTTATGTVAASKGRSSPTKSKSQRSTGSTVVDLVHEAPAFLESSSKVFAKLRLKPEDVVKLTPNRITSVALHPNSQKMIAAAGDKRGYLGLWDCDYVSKDDSDLNQGIYRYRPHVSGICKLDFNAFFDHQLLSTSYDGTLRCLDLNQDAWTLQFQATEAILDTYFTDCSFLLDSPQSVLISKSSGNVALIDFRAAKSASGDEYRYAWNHEVMDTKINSVQVHPTQPHLMITSSNRSGIAVHDLRRAGKKWEPLVAILDHTKSVNAAYVSPDGQYMVSVSLDDTVRTWRNFTGSGAIQSHILRHNNFTGRWLSTFRPAFDPKRASTVALGSLSQPRRIEIYSIHSAAKSGSYLLDMISSLEGEYINSVNSRNCFHPSVDVVLGSNSSGKVHLFR